MAEIQNYNITPIIQYVQPWYAYQLKRRSRSLLHNERCRIEGLFEAYTEENSRILSDSQANFAFIKLLLIKFLTLWKAGMTQFKKYKEI